LVPTVQLTSTRALNLTNQSFSGFKTSADEILGDSTAEPISCTAYLDAGVKASISALHASGYHLLSPSGEQIHNHLSGYMTARPIDTVAAQYSTNLITSNAVYSNFIILDTRITNVQNTRHPLTTVDAAPVSGSTNLISSGGVHTALANLMPNTTIDTSPLSGSGNLISSGAVYAAIASLTLLISSLQTANTALEARVVALEAGGGGGAPDNGSLRQQKYQGYYADNISHFDTTTLIGSASNVTSISIGDQGTNYSYKWYGTFTPDVTGDWLFRTRSDDGSHVYMMASGQSPGDSGTLVVNNGGGHAAQNREGTYTVTTAGTVYTIHIYYGEQSGGAEMSFSWARPGLAYSQDLTVAGIFQPPT
jgi:hypothetical protein